MEAGKKRTITFFYLLVPVVMFLLLLPESLIAADFTLAWDPNTEEDLGGYKIYYKEKSYQGSFDGDGAAQGASPITIPLNLLADPENPRYTITGLKDNKIYFFTITAYDQDDPFNESEYSNITSNLRINSPENNFKINKTSNHTSYLVSGHGLTEATIQVLGNGVLLAAAPPDANGNFSVDIDLLELGEGSVELTLKQKESTSYSVTGLFDLTNPKVAAWDLGDDEITITFDERRIQNATLESNYRFNPSLTFREWGGIIQYSAHSYLLSMTSIPDYEIMSLEMTGITDEVGNPLLPANIIINDRDEDQMADDWETDNGLDPTIKSGSGDIDGDGFSNFSEYQARTDPHDSASAPIVIVDSIPQPAAGIANSARVPTDTSLAVLIASVHGIDVDDPQSVRFNVDDGDLSPYTRELDADTMRLVKVDTLNSVNLYWVVYDRSLETVLPMTYTFDAHIHLTVDIEDLAGNVLPSALFEFNIEFESEHNLALGNMPEVAFFSTTSSGTGHDSGVEVIDGELTGARIEYDGTEPLTPIFGPLNEVDSVTVAGTEDVGIPVNLLPHTVFDKPVKIFIPAPAGFDIGEIGIYYNNGAEWLPACDKYGNLLSGGEGWMVAGSRVNHYETSPPLIEIQVYHFSAAQGGVVVVNSGATAISSGGTSSGGGGGGGFSCFIDAVAYESENRPEFGLLPLLWVIGIIGLLPTVTVYRRLIRNGFLS